MPDAGTGARTGRGHDLEVVCATADGTRALARVLGAHLVGGDVVVLDGPLGAGKTTFVQGLALGLGVTAPVTSPTFVLARHQQPDPSGPRPGGPGLVHVDAYRLAGALELDDLDLDSDLDRSVVVVEWGQGLADRLSPARVEVRLARAEGVAPAGTAADTPAADTPAVDTPVADTPAVDTPVADTPGDEPRSVTVRLVDLPPTRTGPLVTALEEVVRC